MMMNKKNITIIGGGASALMLACLLDSSKHTISIYEKNAALGRKLLVAGKGGFNLTHSESHENFINRYHPKDFIEPFVKHFSNNDLRDWLSSIGIETYVGTSKRVFPIKGIKPIEVLKAIETQLKKNHVSVFYNHTWQGWNGNELVFSHSGDLIKIKSDIVVFALGGSSWKVTGSDGQWTNYFEEKDIQTIPFYPSNCAYKINWDIELIKQISGQALKNCEFTCGNTSKKGEAVLTDFGIEGSGIYALSKEIREQLISQKEAKLLIDFKPELSLNEIQTRLSDRRKLSVKDVLEKKINLTSTQISLLKNLSSKEDYNNVELLSKLIKAFPIQLIDFAPIDDAISTVGGISRKEVNEDLELKKLPNHYIIGEMLNWDASTGGYLLQACFSMGSYLADKLNT